MNDESDYLTTSEVAALLRIKERKVYDLASSGKLPCNKAIGKLLFPRNQIDAWLAEHAEHTIAPITARPSVFLGSHDPLLEWALRESRSGLAMLFDGSNDGLVRFKAREGVAAGLHIHDELSHSWNVDAVLQQCSQQSVVLIEWALRDRGLIVSENLKHSITSLDSLSGYKVAPRQRGAGAQVLFSQLLAQSNIAEAELNFIEPARTEIDIASLIHSGKADAGFGLASVAEAHNLHFVPLIQERFDLLIDRASYFDQALQSLWQFCRTDRFLNHAKSLTGYEIGGLGTVRYNSAIG